MLQFQKKGNAAYSNVEDVYSHVVDPNERRRLALAEIDKAPFTWAHVRLVVVTGVGFFTDAYSLFAINLTTMMLGIVFWQHSNNGQIPQSADTAIKVATSIGTIIGQIGFGYLADLLGRKRMYGVELLIIVTTTLCQALTAPSVAVSFVPLLVFWRVMMGIGVGGDYPTSAVITAEFASTKRRGAMVAAVFSMQGLGQAAAALVTLIVTKGFKDSLLPAKSSGQCGSECLHAVDMMWRIIIGFGGIPAWFALYYRLTIPETPRYTFDVLHDVEKATADSQNYKAGKRGDGGLDRLKQAKVQRQMKVYSRPKPSIVDQFLFFAQWRNGLKLLGTAGSWFFLDVTFYGLGLNTQSVLAAVGFNKKDNVYDKLQNAAVGQLVLICAGAIPGYWVTIATVDILGRRFIQISGFVILTILFAIIGFRYDTLSQGSLLALYILSQFFFNFGPNATTFIIPSECFPTRIRSTAHGLSAGAGKLGAVISQVAFAPMIKRGGTLENPTPWLQGVMRIYSLFMFCGLLTSLLVPETKGLTLEELSGENANAPAYELQFRSNFFRFPKRTFAERGARWHFGRLIGRKDERKTPDMVNEPEMSGAREAFYLQ